MSDFSKSRLSRSDNWATPEGLYQELNREFHFNDDPCPMLHDNSELFLSGLAREWGTSVFINPPYSNPAPFCKKAYEESMKGKTVVGLLRGDTSTKCFHRWVLGKAQEIRFIEGRVCFNGKPAPFNSIIVIWRLADGG